MLNIDLLWSQNLPDVDPVAGPAKSITPDDILKSLRHMKNGKATKPSGVVPDICCQIIADMMNAVIREGKVPAEWSDSITVSLFKGTGDALDRNLC